MLIIDVIIVQNLIPGILLLIIPQLPRLLAPSRPLIKRGIRILKFIRIIINFAIRIDSRCLPCRMKRASRHLPSITSCVRHISLSTNRLASVGAAGPIIPNALSILASCILISLWMAEYFSNLTRVPNVGLSI